MRANRWVYALLSAAVLAAYPNLAKSAEPSTATKLHLEGEQARTLISILVSGGAFYQALKDSGPKQHNAEIVLHDLWVYRESTFKYGADTPIYKLDLYLATAKIGDSQNKVQIGEATALWQYLRGLGLRADVSLGNHDLEVREVNCRIDAEKSFSAPERFDCDLVIPGWELR